MLFGEFARLRDVVAGDFHESRLKEPSLNGSFSLSQNSRLSRFFQLTALHSFTMSNEGFQGKYSWEQLLPNSPLPQANVGSPDDLRKRTWSEESSVSVASTYSNDSSTTNKRTKRSSPEDGTPSASRARYS
jgi:hypothetical protein